MCTLFGARRAPLQFEPGRADLLVGLDARQRVPTAVQVRGENTRVDPFQKTEIRPARVAGQPVSIVDSGLS